MPHFKHKTGGFSATLVNMKKLLLTCLGLAGLTLAGGAAMMASHAALAAGPKLPDYLVRAHAVAASNAIQATPVALDVDASRSQTTEPTYDQGIVTEARTQTRPDDHNDGPQVEARELAFLNSQGGLAPFRALRPIARPSETAAQPTAPAPRAEVTRTRQVAAVTTPQVSRNASVLQRVFRPQQVATRVSSRQPTPRYFHGVFR